MSFSLSPPLSFSHSRMDSFVLAETFKYLYLLFAEEEDLVLDMDDFVFNTEAHLFPLSLANSITPPIFNETPVSLVSQRVMLVLHTHLCN